MCRIRPKIDHVPWWPCEQGAWLVTWWSRVRGWAAAAGRLLAGRPWASRTTGEVHTCSGQLSLLPNGIHITGIRHQYGQIAPTQYISNEIEVHKLRPTQPATKWVANQANYSHHWHWTSITLPHTVIIS